MSDSLDQLQKTESAILLINKLLPELPDYSVFHFAEYAKNILGWDKKIVSEIAVLGHHIVHLALNQLGYVNEKTKGYYYELTDKGRAAKLVGGHFAYLKKVDADREFEKKKQLIDIRSKEFGYRVRRLPFIFSAFSLIGTIISIFIAVKALNYKKQPEKESKPVITIPPSRTGVPAKKDTLHHL